MKRQIHAKLTYLKQCSNGPERTETTFRFVILAFASIPVGLNKNLRVPDRKSKNRKNIK